MPKLYRLSGDEIKRLSEQPGSIKRIHGALFSLSYAPLSGKHPKIATIVSKKAAARAVDRNLIKRRVRASLQKHIAALPAPSALMFYAKKEAARADFDHIRDDIEKLLAKVRK